MTRKTVVSFTIEPEVLNAIDRQRGQVSRSLVVNEYLKKRFVEARDAQSTTI